MGVLDTINAALGGKPAASQPANKVVRDSRPMTELYAGKVAQMARMGLNPDGSPMQKAMAAHADAVHPVPK